MSFGYLLLVQAVAILVRHIYCECDTQPKWLNLQNGTAKSDNTPFMEEISSPSLTFVDCASQCLYNTPDCIAMSLACTSTTCKCTLFLTGIEIHFSPFDASNPMQFCLKSSILGRNIPLTSDQPVSFYLGGMPRHYSQVQLVFSLPSIKTTMQFILTNNNTMFSYEIRMAEQEMVVYPIVNGAIPREDDFTDDDGFLYEGGRLVDIMLIRTPNSFKVLADLVYMGHLSHWMWEFDEIVTFKVIPEGDGGFINTIVRT